MGVCRISPGKHPVCVKNSRVSIRWPMAHGTSAGSARSTARHGHAANTSSNWSWYFTKRSENGWWGWISAWRLKPVSGSFQETGFSMIPGHNPRARSRRNRGRRPCAAPCSHMDSTASERGAPVSKRQEVHAARACQARCPALDSKVERAARRLVLVDLCQDPVRRAEDTRRTADGLRRFTQRDASVATSRRQPDRTLRACHAGRTWSRQVCPRSRS